MMQIIIAALLTGISADVQVYFSPGDTYEKVIVQALDEARGYAPCTVCEP